MRWDTLALIIYLMLWVALLIIQKRKVKGWGVGTMLVLCFVIYSALSIILFVSKKQGFNNYSISMPALVYLFVMIMAFLTPALRYERADVRRIQKPSYWILYSFIMVYFICTLVGLPSMIVHMQEGLATLFMNEDGGADLYQGALEQYEGAMSDSVNGLYGLCAIFHNFFRDIAIFVIFYLVTIDKRKWLTVILLVPMVLDMIQPITAGNRAQFVKTFMTMIVCYFLFRTFWGQQMRIIAQRVVLVVTVVSLVPFMAITISRFGGNTYSGGTSGGMLRYSGQAILNFSQNAFNTNGTRHGDHVCHEFKRMLGMEVPESQFEIRRKYSSMTMDDSVFYTFVGDFVLDFGPVIASLIFIVLFLLFMSGTCPRNYTIKFHELLLLYFTMCVCAQGGMYQFTYSLMGNYCIIAFGLLYLLCILDYRMQQDRRKVRYIVIEE